MFSCSSNISRNLGVARGIHEVNVALLAGKMEVNFDPSMISTDDIVKIVCDLGFECKYLYVEDHGGLNAESEDGGVALQVLILLE